MRTLFSGNGKRLRIRASGVAAGILIFLLTHSAVAQTYSVVYAFSGPPDGAGPETLTLDKAGNFYGETVTGGALTNGLYCYFGPGCGTVFKIDSSGKESVLYTFAPVGIEKGYIPSGTAMLRDGAGNLYGTTFYGGDIGCDSGRGCGTVFKVNPAGKETVLYRFTGVNGDGAFPNGLARDTAGNLYGTTSEGGEHNLGTVFKLDSAGNETVLHEFQGSPNDGAEPIEGVVLDAEGNVYGTTFLGGTDMGTIFEVSNTGVETVLYNFSSTANTGFEAEGSLLRDPAGNLYGTTVGGGDLNCTTGGCGVVYRLGADGTYTVLHGFTGADGAFPQTGLGRDAAGNLYGMTSTGGGKNACGTVFRLSPGGQLTVLHAFTGCGEDGVVPDIAPIVDAARNIYGTTGSGGPITSECPSGCGVVFKITP